MKVFKTKLEGVLKIKLSPFHDFRGKYLEIFNKKLFKKTKKKINFIQDDISISKKNVLRGIHGDYITWKLITCLHGKFLLLVVNNIKNHKEYKKSQIFELSEDNNLQILVPPGFGNSHYVKTKRAILVADMNQNKVAPFVTQGLFNSITEDINEDELELVFECLSKALLAVDKFRITEGAFLEKDMALRINNILNLLTEVDKYEKQRAVNIKQRIKTNLSNFMQDPVTDNNRLEQEMIYYIEKLDITEEKLRLKNNCDYFLENINNVESSGKKLGFIVQEIGREINTLGSKANDSSLQRVVVLMKDELEKIKEQLFNIL